MSNNPSNKDTILDFLIANQEAIKEDLMHLNQRKDEWLAKVHSSYRLDFEDQYNARINQHIAFVCSDALALPDEYVIIELENINIEDYLNV